MSPRGGGHRPEDGSPGPEASGRRRPVAPSDPRADIEDELAFHLESRVRDLVRAGTDPARAREQAEREFGDVERVRGELRAIGRRRRSRARRGRLLSEGLGDLRAGLRALRRNPSYAAALLATLAMVVGATTTVFSLVNGVLLRPLPYPDADALVVAWERNVPREAGENVVSVPMYEAWRERARAFSEMAGLVPDRQTLREGGPERVEGAAVTAGWFDVVATPPALGRGFTEEEARRGGVVVLSHGLWRDRFGGDREVLGRTVALTGAAHTVVGVMPEGFEPPAFGWLGPEQRYWVPFAPDEGNRGWGRFLLVLGRLAPGASVERADEELKRIVREREETDDARLSEWTADAVPLHAQVTGGVRGPLLVLLVAVGFLALIGVVNVTNLVLARAQRRGGEFGVRAALGAGRGRLARQLLAEALAVAVVAAPLGLAAAWLGVEALPLLLPDDVPRASQVRLDAAALGTSLLVAAVATLALGVAPALLAAVGRRRGRPGIRGGAGTSGRPLVVAEVALALVLSVGAGLAMRSFVAMRAVPLGFDGSDVVAFRVSIPSASYPSGDERRAFYRRLLETLAARPGVGTAAAVNVRPLRGGGTATTTWAVGTERDEGAPVADVRVATPGYFETLRIDHLAGRGLEATEAGPRAAVVSASLARALFPGRDPLGERFVLSMNPPDTVAVAGVVEDVRLAGPEAPPRPTVYFSHAVDPRESMDVVVRADLPAAAVVSMARTAVAEIDPSLPIYEVETLRRRVEATTARQRVEFALLAGFSLLALLLAATGIYGVLAMEVGRRTREIAVRIALGAAPARVRGDVVRGALRVTLVGLGVGLAGALVLTRFMESILFGVEPTDPATYAGVVAVLVAVALAAAWAPARRAARVPPAESMRADAVDGRARIA